MVWLILLVLFYLQVVTVIILDHKRPEVAMVWVAIICLVPFVGFMMYYLIARRFAHKRLSRRIVRHLQQLDRQLFRLSRPDPDEERRIKEQFGDERLWNVLRQLPGAPMTGCNETKVYADCAEMYDAILAEMERAEDHIHLEYYTVRDDGIGRQFRDMMIRKALEGVEVRLLYDGIGSLGLTDAFLRKLEAAGVETRCFSPVRIALFDKRLNYRNHRKLVVVDGKVGFLGGANIGDEYLGQDPRLGYWRDTQVKLSGDAVRFLQRTFLEDWMFAGGEPLVDPRYYREHGGSGREWVQIVNGGPDMDGHPVLELFFAVVTAARERVHVITPYFILDPGLRMALKMAAIGGVDVRIIIPGIPDTKVVYWASLSYVEELLRAGVRFYQYERGFIHSKIVIVDDKLATVGTANLDMRSFYSNFEQVAVLYGGKAIRELEEVFARDLQGSREIRLKAFAGRPVSQKVKEHIGRLLAPLF